MGEASNTNKTWGPSDESASSVAVPGPQEASWNLLVEFLVRSRSSVAVPSPQERYWNSLVELLIRVISMVVQLHRIAEAHKKHFDTFVAIVSSFIGIPYDSARDAVAEAFAKCVRRTIRGRRIKKNARAYVRKAAINCGRDIVRRWERERAGHSVAAGRVREPAASDERAAINEELEKLQVAMDGPTQTRRRALKTKDLEILTLTFFEELGDDEIAERLGEKRSAFSPRLVRAIDKLIMLIYGRDGQRVFELIEDAKERPKGDEKAFTTERARAVEARDDYRKRVRLLLWTLSRQGRHGSST
jgi:RNA polymerase sigma factor (sigma-70 family)